MQRQRIQFRCSESAVRKIDELAHQVGASSRNEVLKIAIGLLDWAVGHLIEGRKIGAMTDGEAAETIVIPGLELTIEEVDGG